MKLVAFLDFQAVAKWNFFAKRLRNQPENPTSLRYIQYLTNYNIYKNKTRNEENIFLTALGEFVS